MIDLLAEFKRLQQAVIESAIVFEVLVGAARVCLRGQIADTLFEAGGRDRRNT